MKVSRYNLFFPLKEKYIIYNTLEDTVAVADGDLKQILETQTLEDLGEDVKQSLLQCKIITSDETDEKAVLHYRFQVAKYSADFISVLLLPTLLCNLSCHYCPSPAKSVFMDAETTHRVTTFLKNLTQSANRGIILKLYGGEPLLHSDCCQALCEALSVFCQSKNVPFLAAAMTNGTLLTHKKTEGLLSYLGAIHVTLDGYQQYHDSIRHYSNGKGTYEDIMEGLSLAREMKIRISVRVNITAENLDSIKDLLEDLKRRKFDEYTLFDIYFGPIAPMEECNYFKDDASSLKFKEDTCELVPRLRDIVAATKWAGKTRDIISDLKNVARPEQCQYSKAYNFIIDPLGKFYTCPAFIGDPDYCIGALTDEGAEFTSLYYDIHTRDVTLLACQDCEYLPICGGGCPVRAHMRNKTVDSYYCGSTKELTASRMLLYLQHKRPDLFRR